MNEASLITPYEVNRYQCLLLVALQNRKGDKIYIQNVNELAAYITCLI